MNFDPVAWWLILQVIGLVGLPIAFLVFRRLPDRGYAFSKPLGLLLLGYVFWILVNVHILPNSARGAAWALVFLAVVAGWIAWRRREELLAWAAARWRYALAVEVLITFAFAAALFLRSYVPEIAGTEKPMDFMFMNAVNRSEGFPPDDPWLAGEGVSYYYFGHLLVVTVGRLAGVSMAMAFNIGLAMVFALAVVAAFGLVFNLVAMRQGDDGVAADEPIPVRPVMFGLAAAALLVVVSNLEGVFEFMAAHGVGGGDFYSFVGIENLDATKTSERWYPTEHWFWWRATRILPDASGSSISEFPFFSFLLGDLHPHVMSIPFVLLTVGFGMALLQREEALDGAFWRRNLGLLAVAAVMVGGLLFLNTWDVFTFAFLLVALAFIANWRQRPPDGGGRGRRRTRARPVEGSTALWQTLRPPLTATLGFATPLVLAALLAYVPFIVSFSSQADGFAAVTNVYTRPLHFLLFWGPLVAVTLPYLWQRLVGPEGPAIRDRHVATALAPGAFLLLVWFFWALFQGDGLVDIIADRKSGWLTAFVMVALLGAFLLAAWRELASTRRTPDLVALTAGAVAILLILGAEFFRVRDVFNPSRLNTVFKLYYQAWLLLAVVGGYALFRFAQSFEGRAWGSPVWRQAWSGALSLVLLAALVYPVTATLNRTNGLDGTRTLDGLAFANRDEVQAASWLEQHADAGAVIIEAVGGSYSEAARISTWTGIPNPIGWPGHESQWRCRPGDACHVLDGRFEDVERLYRSADEAEVRGIIDKYGASFVVVGPLERLQYGEEAETLLGRMLPIAFQQGDVIIYRAGGLEATVTGGP